VSLSERLEEAHLDWVTDPRWCPGFPPGLDRTIREEAADRYKLFDEALEEYLRGLGYPRGPHSYLWP
jgi:hypothetical protein